MVNNIRILLGALVFVGLATPAVASEQDKLAKWNTDVNKNIRQAHADKLAQTTYKEINVKDARVSNDASKVYPQIETKVTKDGSATRVVAEAVLNTDKEKVAKDWAKKLGNAAKYGKGVLGGAAVGLLVDQLLEAIDWVMDEGGNISRPNTPPNGEISPADPKRYITASLTQYYGSAKSACYASFAVRQLSFDGTITYLSNTETMCYYTMKPKSGSSWTSADNIHSSSNPSYNPNYKHPSVTATENEVKDAIKSKVLDNPQKQNLAKDIVKDSYARIWDDKGNSLEIRGDVTNKQKDILNSNDPTSDGHTTSTPTISDGKSGSGSSSSGSSSSGTSEGTTFNPDGSVASSSVTTTTTTSTSTTNIEFELPAFCDWASTVCEWLEWTKEEPEEPQLDDSVSIDEKEIEVTYAPHFLTSFDPTCPADIPLDLNIMGTTQHFVIPMAPFCTFFSSIRPFVIGLASLLAVYIIGNAARAGES